MSEENPVHEMTTEECWDLIKTQEFGRMAFHLAEQVHITPINYAVDGETLLFRTAEGSKLLAVVMNPDIAFEIDDYTDDTALRVGDREETHAELPVPPRTRHQTADANRGKQAAQESSPLQADCQFDLGKSVAARLAGSPW